MVHLHPKGDSLVTPLPRGLGSRIQTPDLIRVLIPLRILCQPDLVICYFDVWFLLFLETTGW